MSAALLVLAAALCLVGTFVFATLTHSLRDYSRAVLIQLLGGDDDDHEHPPAAAIIDREEQLAVVSGAARVVFGVGLVLATVPLVGRTAVEARWQPAVVLGVCLLLLWVAAVALPLAVSRHAPEAFIARFANLLRLTRLALLPVVLLHRPLDAVVARLSGGRELMEEELEQEIRDIVAEGSKEGVIDEGERQMIERTLRFHDATAEQAMTGRGEIVAVPVDADVETVRNVIEESGHSRIPVYRETLDEVAGILYARDLFRLAGRTVQSPGHTNGHAATFDLATMMRPPMVVPETKPLADLLRDMQLQKIHMAVVLDEYGGTSGVVTIEDILEELVGDIEDEHDYDEAVRVERLGETTAEADARARVENVNRVLGLRLPEEEGFESLGGFVTSAMGRIPRAGEAFEHRPAGGRGVRVTVLSALPQKVERLRLELLDAEPPAAPPVA